jgi:hypothetical protein
LIKQKGRNKCLVKFNKEVIGTLIFFLPEVYEEDALLRVHVSKRNRMTQEKRVYLEKDKKNWPFSNNKNRYIYGKFDKRTYCRLSTRIVAVNFSVKKNYETNFNNFELKNLCRKWYQKNMF